MTEVAVLVGDPVTGNITARHAFQLAVSDGAIVRPPDLSEPADHQVMEDRSSAIATIHTILSSMPCCCYHSEWTMPYLEQAFESEGLARLKPHTVTCLLREMRARYPRLDTSLEATAWRLRLPVREELLGPLRAQASTVARFCFEATQALLKPRGETRTEGSVKDSSLLALLDDLRAVEDVLQTRAAQRRASEAPDFNALSFVGTDERLVSTLLAALLDPNHAHGQARCSCRVSSLALRPTLPSR